MDGSDVPQEPKDRLEIQQRILEDTAKERGILNIWNYVVDQGPRFSGFTKYFSPRLKTLWDNAVRDPGAYAELKREYVAFEHEFEDFVSRIDPEARTAVTEAIERGDVNAVYHILEAQVDFKEGPKEE